MPDFVRRYFPIFLLTGCFVAVVSLYLKVKQPPAESPAPPPQASPTVIQEPPPRFSPLATAPDWKTLDAFQGSITRADFERLLTSVFTVGDRWKEFIILTEANAVIRTETGGIYILNFAAESPTPFPKPWKATADLPPAPADQPLKDVHIAIDPGHIGGEWAKMEERWFIYNGGNPVTEGDMTLFVAKLLKPKLEALGATVSLVRDKPEPVTPKRPESLLIDAESSVGSPDSPEALQKLAERLFYRTAEIRARAEIVNRTIQPDLVLCLHFNAEAWGDPNQPTLVPKSHLHLILNGAYNSEEIGLADQRFTMIRKLLSHTHEEEAFIGTTVADTFAEISGLPPYPYLPDASAQPVNGHPYLWARNLLANRLYDAPVIYMEPYVMNSITDYARIQAGDYDGVREIEGKSVPSIFREYADALAEGLRRHYVTHRKKSP
jgi:N-acetylmuramoyl-L-alanine amidase